MKGNEINIYLRALCQQIRDSICIFIAPILVIVNSNCVAAVDRAVYKFNHVSIGLFYYLNVNQKVHYLWGT